MDKLKDLYKQRAPIKEIIKQTGLSRATIYRHLLNSGVKIRTISESRTGMKLPEEYKRKIRSTAIKNKRIGAENPNTVKLKDGYDKITNDLAYIIGVMFGDGYIVSSSGIGLESIDNDFVEEFSERVKRQFGIKSMIYNIKRGVFKDWRNGKEYNRKPTYTMRANSVLLRDFILKIKTFEIINKFNRDQKILFLRGLWDSEGMVNITGVNTSVTFTQKTKKICEVFNNLMFELTGIPAKILKSNYQELYKVYFYRKEYIIKFYDIIQPTIQRKRDVFEKIKRLYLSKQ